MKKDFIFILSCCLFSLSYNFSCYQFYGPTCEGHNNLDDYNLKCHYLNSQCQEVETDHFCEINSLNECAPKTGVNIPAGEACSFYMPKQIDHIYCKKIKIDDECGVDLSGGCHGKDTLESNEKCELSSDNYYCQKMEKTCSDYKESTCGGKILTSDTKQCIYVGDNFNYNGKELKCAEYEVDQNCQVKLNEGGSDLEKVICTKRDGAQFEEDVYSCKFNNDGFYDSDSCKLGPKKCSKITNSEKCSLGKLSSEFSVCSKVGDSCEEFFISPSCKITEKGACVIKEPVEGQRCEFYEGKSCLLFEKGKGCKINLENQETMFCENGENVPSNKMCFINFDEDSDLNHVRCTLKDIVCEVISSEDKCTGTDMIIEGKKYYCVWDTDLYNNGVSERCYQFVYDDYCTRKDKKCVPKEGVTLGENEKCELTIDGSNDFLKCRKKDAKNIMMKPNVLTLLNQTLSNVIIVKVVKDYS